MPKGRMTVEYTKTVAMEFEKERLIKSIVVVVLLNLKLSFYCLNDRKRKTGKKSFTL